MVVGGAAGADDGRPDAGGGTTVATEETPEGAETPRAGDDPADAELAGLWAVGPASFFAIISRRRTILVSESPNAESFQVPSKRRMMVFISSTRRIKSMTLARR